MKILLPIDGSAPALEAVHQALLLTRAGLRASFVLANVQEPPSLYEVVVAHNAAVIENVSVAAAEHSLEAAQALLRNAGVPHEVEIAAGDPGHLLVDIAENFGCELVIMGARGVGGAGGSGLGSVAQSVLHSAGVPVMIVTLADASG